MLSLFNIILFIGTTYIVFLSFPSKVIWVSVLNDFIVSISISSRSILVGKSYPPGNISMIEPLIENSP